MLQVTWYLPIKYADWFSLYLRNVSFHSNTTHCPVSKMIPFDVCPRFTASCWTPHWVLPHIVLFCSLLSWGMKYYIRGRWIWFADAYHNPFPFFFCRTLYCDTCLAVLNPTRGTDSTNNGLLRSHSNLIWNVFPLILSQQYRMFSNEGIQSFFILSLGFSGLFNLLPLLRNWSNIHPFWLVPRGRCG